MWSVVGIQRRLSCTDRVHTCLISNDVRNLFCCMVVVPGVCFVLILSKRIGSRHTFTWLDTITFRIKAFITRFFFVLEFWHMFHLNWVDWTRSTFNCIRCIQYCISIHWNFQICCSPKVYYFYSAFNENKFHCLHIIRLRMCVLYVDHYL